MHQTLYQRIIVVIRTVVQRWATRRYHFRKLDSHLRTGSAARASLSRLLRIVAVAAKGI